MQSVPTFMVMSVGKVFTFKSSYITSLQMMLGEGFGEIEDFGLRRKQLCILLALEIAISIYPSRLI